MISAAEAKKESELNQSKTVEACLKAIEIKIKDAARKGHRQCYHSGVGAAARIELANNGYTVTDGSTSDPRDSGLWKISW